jgi:hypothetical protein
MMDLRDSSFASSVAGDHIRVQNRAAEAQGDESRTADRCFSELAAKAVVADCASYNLHESDL